MTAASTSTKLVNVHASGGNSIAICLAFLTLILFVFPAHGPSASAELRFVTWRPQPPWMWDQAIADFERQNPGTKVVRELGPHSSTDFHDLVTHKLRNRDAEMDVFLTDVIWPAEFAAAGWALPLGRWFPVHEQNKFLAPPILANTYHGEIYGVPLFTDAALLYYRKDLLDKYNFSPPETWPELVEQARNILSWEKDPHLTGFSGQFKQYEGLICNMMEYILANGGALWDEKQLKSLLHLPRSKEAVRFVRDRIIGEISHRGVLAYQEPESLALFTQGKAVFHRNWPYAWEIANDPASSKVAGRVGIVHLPGFSNKSRVATLGGWQLSISRFSRRPELAWKFVEFMTGKEMQKRIALFMARAPTRRELYEDSEILNKNPQFKFHFENLTHAVPRPRTPVYIPLSNIMQRYFSSAIAIRDSDIDRLAALAARDMDRVLDLLRTKR